MRTLGAEISVLDHGQVEIRLGYRPTLTQQNGFIHAGVLTSILDSACGYAAMSVGPEKHDVLSVEFKVNLLRPAKGEEFLAIAGVLKPGRTLTVVRADVFANPKSERVLVATMLGTMMCLMSRQ